MESTATVTNEFPSQSAATWKGIPCHDCFEAHLHGQAFDCTLLMQTSPERFHPGWRCIDYSLHQLRYSPLGHSDPAPFSDLNDNDNKNSNTAEDDNDYNNNYINWRKWGWWWWWWWWWCLCLFFITILTHKGEVFFVFMMRFSGTYLTFSSADSVRCGAWVQWPPSITTGQEASSLPPSHCCELCLRTNTKWHSLRIAQHRIDSNYYELVRWHFRISSQANTNVLKCSKHSYWPCESKSVRIASYCIAERRISSCQFILVRISSLYIRIDSLYILTGVRILCATTQYVAIRCAKIALLYWIAHVRIGSCKFLLVPVVFSLHRSAIVLILHHHRTASHCIVSPSFCIYCNPLHRINSCLIRVWLAWFANNHSITSFWFGIKVELVRNPNFKANNCLHSQAISFALIRTTIRHWGRGLYS